MGTYANNAVSLNAFTPQLNFSPFCFAVPGKEAVNSRLNMQFLGHHLFFELIRISKGSQKSPRRVRQLIKSSTVAFRNNRVFSIFIYCENEPSSFVTCRQIQSGPLCSEFYWYAVFCNWPESKSLQLKINNVGFNSYPAVTLDVCMHCAFLSVCHRPSTQTRWERTAVRHWIQGGPLVIRKVTQDCMMQHSVVHRDKQTTEPKRII